MRNTYNYISGGLYMEAKTFRNCPELAAELDLTKNQDLTYKGKGLFADLSLANGLELRRQGSFAHRVVNSTSKCTM